MENLIHIIFDQAGAENLRQSFALDDIISGEILVLEDDLAFGPLKTLSPGEQTPDRQSWWDRILGEGVYTKIATDSEHLTDLGQQMRTDPDNEIWIWAAQNARDVAGYYALVDPLRDFTGRIHLIYLNNLPFINEKGGIFYPSYLSEILPREFLKARKLAREITAAEVEVDGEEWKRLVEENAPVRILEGGKKLRSEQDDYFDKELTGRCRLEFLKGWRLVNQTQQKCKDHIHEDFLYHRLGFLIESGALTVKGEYKQLRDAEVRAAGAASEAEPVIQNGNDESDHK